VSANKILLVDDDAVFLLGMSLLLRAAGFEVATAEDGSETVEAMTSGKPDLIIMDILFSPTLEQQGKLDWDGFRIMNWLRCVKGDANVPPVIFLTGADQSEYRERARNAGAVAVFEKTVETAELIELIHRLLD
jgi:CheY-like chemotaxis protein